MAIPEQFLVPKRGDKEVIVLSDAALSASVVLTRSDSMVLSDRATRLLYKSLFGTTPKQLKTVAGARAIKDKHVVAWLRDSARAGLFSLSSRKPETSPPAA